MIMYLSGESLLHGRFAADNFCHPPSIMSWHPDVNSIGSETAQWSSRQQKKSQNPFTDGPKVRPTKSSDLTDCSRSRKVKSGFQIRKLASAWPEFISDL